MQLILKISWQEENFFSLKTAYVLSHYGIHDFSNSEKKYEPTYRLRYEVLPDALFLSPYVFHSEENYTYHLKSKLWPYT